MEPSLSSVKWDAVVVGGGFYGCAVASYLAKRKDKGRRSRRTSERLDDSGVDNNQARRPQRISLPSKFRHRLPKPRKLSSVCRALAMAVVRDFMKIYAVPRRNSKVTFKQFERFCLQIGSPLRPADDAVRRLFSTRLVEAVYVCRRIRFRRG